jgi:hypothetical protein
MAYRTRIKYTAAQKSDIWDRWQRGESLNSIGRLFDRHSTSIFGLLAPTGGIRPPPCQRRGFGVRWPDGARTGEKAASRRVVGQIGALECRSAPHLAGQIDDRPVARTARGGGSGGRKQGLYLRYTRKKTKASHVTTGKTGSLRCPVL